MEEYIKKEELIRKITCNMAEFIGEPDDVQKHDEQCNYAIRMIEEASVADVVEVVRCKDCKYYRKRVKGSIYDDDTCDILYYCDGSHRIVCEEDFCSYGERRKYATD